MPINTFWCFLHSGEYQFMLLVSLCPFAHPPTLEVDLVVWLLLSPLATQQAKKMRNEMLGQGIVRCFVLFCFLKHQTVKMTDECPEKPSCSIMNVNLFQETKRGWWGDKVKKRKKKKSYKLWQIFPGSLQTAEGMYSFLLSYSHLQVGLAKMFPLSINRGILS